MDNENSLDKMAARVALLEAERDVAALLYGYAECVDAQDAAMLAALFTEDSGFYPPKGKPLVGRDAVQAVYTRLLGELAASSHLVGNVRVSMVEGNRALAGSVFHSWDTYLPDAEGNRKPDCFTFGRYDIVAVRHGGRWLIQELHVSFAGQLFR